MPTIKELQARVNSLQLRVSPRASIAQRLKAARERKRAMTPEERTTERAARAEWAMNSPEPPEGTFRNRLWHAERRLATLAPDVASS